jgi:hypothetical protein
MQHIQYNSNVGDAKFVEDSLIAIVGDSGFLSFWDVRTDSIVQTADVSDS